MEVNKDNKSIETNNNSTGYMIEAINKDKKVNEMLKNRLRKYIKKLDGKILKLFIEN